MILTGIDLCWFGSVPYLYFLRFSSPLMAKTVLFDFFFLHAIHICIDKKRFVYSSLQKP
jgi:hypothetical protein